MRKQVQVEEGRETLFSSRNKKKKEIRENRLARERKRRIRYKTGRKGKIVVQLEK